MTKKLAIVPIDSEIGTATSVDTFDDGLFLSWYPVEDCKLTRAQIEEMAKARHNSMRETIKKVFGSCLGQPWDELDDDTIKLNINDMTAAVKAIGLEMEDGGDETI